MLTISNFRAYAFSVAAHQRPGLATRNQGGQAASNAAIFTSVNTRTPFGRAVWEGFGPAGSLIRFANLHGSALPFGDWMAEIQPPSRSLTS